MSSRTRRHRFNTPSWVIVAAALLITLGGQVVRAHGDDALTYERDVRPILKTHCFHCHGEGDVLAGGLDLRLRRLIVRGGESGPAVVAGDSSASRLVQRLTSGEMPPEDVEHRPTEVEVERIGRWIAQGAVTARAEPETILAGYITEEERNYWAFRPVRRPQPPRVTHSDRVRTPIDQFVLARLEKHGLSVAPDADARTLVRRASIDLLGLPPHPDEVEAFVRDVAPDAYERLIDRLLASPHYGERWGRHWLDVAGYADSEGYTDEDIVRSDAYKYRDYVIRSLAADKPFDAFICEQLAGDEMVGPDFRNLTPEAVDRLIATGFLRMAPDGTGAGGVDQGVARNEVIAKTIEIVSTSMMGLTVACAQCHDHRYDPIPQQDYYRLRAVFEPAFDWQNWLVPAKRRILLYSESDRQAADETETRAKAIDAARATKQGEMIEAVFQRELAKLPADLHESIREARTAAPDKRTADQAKLLKEHPSVNVTAGSLYLYDPKAADALKKLADDAATLRATKPEEVYLRALWEPADKSPPATFVFHRGDHEQPKQQVAPGELSVLTPADLALPASDAGLPTTGRRLAYARWLTSGQHPLVARVLVNRVWMHHFGRGIVATTGDFGALGTRPSHSQLLDWLADEFPRQGWSLKKLHRLIMTSTVYRQASRGDLRGAEIDVENRLLWHAPVRRLEAEVIRDGMLAISGRINARQFGPAVPVMADRTGQFVIGIENLNAGRPGEVLPMKGEDLRRSVYVQVRRSRPLGVLDTFDAPRMDPNCTVRNSSTVSPQSLMLMNSDRVIEFARRTAERVAVEAGEDLQARLRRAWYLILARPPTADELGEAVPFVTAQAAFFAARDAKQEKKSGDSGEPRLEALASLCHALLSCNEFLYVE